VNNYTITQQIFFHTTLNLLLHAWCCECGWWPAIGDLCVCHDCALLVTVVDFYDGNWSTSTSQLFESMRNLVNSTESRCTEPSVCRSSGYIARTSTSMERQTLGREQGHSLTLYRPKRSCLMGTKGACLADRWLWWGDQPVWCMVEWCRSVACGSEPPGHWCLLHAARLCSYPKGASWRLNLCKSHEQTNPGPTFIQLSASLNDQWLKSLFQYLFNKPASGCHWIIMIADKCGAEWVTCMTMTVD